MRITIPYPKIVWKCDMCGGQIRWRDLFRGRYKGECDGKQFAGWCVRH